jgi:GH24 family phage-related lysozyme (muramidase)
MRDDPDRDRPAAMTSLRAVSEAGLAFIKAHEGFRARSARLPDGRWLIGHSSVEEDGEGVEITAEEAEERLRRDLAPIEETLNELVFAPLTQGQFDALVSLGFSIGVDGLRGSGVADALTDGRPIDAAKAFDAWTQADVGGEIRAVDALVRRRAAEKAMFLALADGPVAASSALLRPVSTAGGSSSTPRSGRGAAGPDPALIARLNKILPEPPVEAGEEVRGAAGRVAELGEVRARPRAASALPAAPYPLRRGMTTPGATGFRASRAPAPFAARAGRGGVLALEAAADWTEAWPWALCGAGLALLAVGAANLRGASGNAEAVWVLAVVVGVLAAAAGGYVALRRQADPED